MEVLELTYAMDGDIVSSGVDDSPENPLARATQCLFLEGKPFKRLNNCFFLDADGQMRWLGIFVHSAGDRVIFFPGFFELQQHITAYNGDTLRWDQEFKIDHLSLEPDWRSWHFTEPSSVAHLGKMYTHQLAPDVFHWFSMSVKSKHDLRIARKETKVSAITPPKDIDRRLQIFKASRENAEFQIIGLNESSLSHPPNFFHFSVTIGPPGFVLNNSDILGIPYGSPLVKEHPDKPLADIPCRAHRIRLSDRVELEVTSSVLLGDLQNQIVFSGLPNRIRLDQGETGFRQFSSAATSLSSYPSRRSISAIAALLNVSGVTPDCRASVGMTGLEGIGSWHAMGIGTFTRCTTMRSFVAQPAKHAAVAKANRLFLMAAPSP